MGPVIVGLIETIIIPVLVSLGTSSTQKGIESLVSSKKTHELAVKPADAYILAKKSFQEASRSNSKLNIMSNPAPGYDLSYNYDANGVMYEFHFSDTSNYILFRELHKTLGKWEVSKSSSIDPMEVRKIALNYIQNGASKSEDSTKKL